MKQKKHMTFMTALFLFSILSFLSLMMINMSSTEGMVADNQISLKQAELIADEGIQIALLKLSKNPFIILPYTWIEKEPGATYCKYKYVIELIASDRVQIKCTANFLKDPLGEQIDAVATTEAEVQVEPDSHIPEKILKMKKSYDHFAQE